MGFLEKIVVNSKLDYWYHKHFGFNRKLRSIQISNNSLILEIGAGAGITSTFIADKFPNSKIIATDFDPAQVEKAKQKVVRSNIEFRREDATQLSFPKGYFDVCFASLVFHHIENFPQAINEVYRALKSGGRFFIYEIPAKTWNPFWSWFPLGTPGVFSRDEFTNLLKKVGFKLTKIQGNLPFWAECYK